MAFLDNSGDIIMDAVLTDIGRRRMAAGNFRITKFALGDDEVDYTLYNRDHASGSAYTDLEILQTPIFEAFSKGAAGINYGLTTMNNNVLYMPEIIQNEITNDNAVRTSNGIIYIAANSETSTALVAVGALGDNKYFLESGALVGSKIMFESGINSPDVDATQANTSIYISNQGMLDTGFSVDFDGNIFGGIYGTTSNSRFTNNHSSGRDEVNMKLRSVGVQGASPDRPGFSRARINGVANTVTDVPGGTPKTNISVIRGPGGTAAAMNFTLHPALTNTKDAGTTSSLWSRKGQTGVDVFGDSNTYDVLTTTVTVTGDASGQLQTFTCKALRRAT
jgi:hypothetical protein